MSAGVLHPDGEGTKSSYDRCEADIMLSEVLARADGSPSSNIALLSTPRSGSSLLGDRIINTQQLGTPREWINPGI